MALQSILDFGWPGLKRSVYFEAVMRSGFYSSYNHSDGIPKILWLRDNIIWKSSVGIRYGCVPGTVRE